MKDSQDLLRIQELKQLILKYDKQYYEEGQSDISDAEYDRLYAEYLEYEDKYPELKDMADAPTRRIGAGDYAGHTTSLPKYHHKSPLLSINRKGKELSELKAFYDSIGGEGTEVIIEPKLDGITCNINYENGRLVNAATRGNGYIGDLVTENFKNTETSYPKMLEDNASLEVRGEAIIPYDYFKTNLSKDYSNPRNAVSGIMRSIAPQDVKDKGIIVMFYDVGTYKNMLLENFDDKNVDIIKTLGFSSVPVIKVNTWERLKEVCETKMEGYIQEIDGFNVLQCKGYPQAVCDGLVIKVNDLSQRQLLGMTEKGPRWAMAFKFKPLQATTRIDHIEWQVGKTGKVVPVAVFNEISLGGVKITRATLNNYEYMKSLPLLFARRDVCIDDTYDNGGQTVDVPYDKPIQRMEYIQEGDVLIDDKHEKSVGELHRITVKKVDKDGFYISHPLHEDDWYDFESDRYYLVDTCPGLQADDVIVVERSNDVIPRIIAIHHHQSIVTQQDYLLAIENTKRQQSFNPPQKCPVCGHPLHEVGPQIFCQNPSCKAQLQGKLEQFVSRDAMNIVGLGGSIIEEFVNQGFIADFEGIYHLDKHKEAIIALDKFGIRKYNNLIKSINNSKEPELANFIYALCIQGVGKKTAKDLAKHFQTLDGFMNADYKELINIDDISHITAKSITEWIQDNSNKNLVNRLCQAGIHVHNVKAPDENFVQAFAGKNFVITGKLSHPRQYFQKQIEERGGKVLSGVSKKTHYVLIGDDAGSKEEKAKKLIAQGADIKLINEKEFIKML